MKKTEERKKDEKRSHRSRYSLNTEYSFGTDSTRRTKAQNEVSFLFSELVALMKLFQVCPFQRRMFTHALQFRDLLDNWDSISPMQRNRMLRSSIPEDLLGELWLKLSGAGDLIEKNTGVYDMVRR
jgi:hypothetical protein